MAINSNTAIRQANGDIIKMLYMDDYLAHKNSLQLIADSFIDRWLVTGCIHDDEVQCFNPHYPYYNSEIATGKNTIGSPSVLAFANDKPLLFDENLTWLLDCDLYERLYRRYGKPTILSDLNVGIGIGEHQATHIMGEEIKLLEYEYMSNKK